MWLQFFITHAANPYGSPGISYFRYPGFTFIETGLLIISQVPIVYIMLYVILPKFILRRKYFLGLLAIIVLWFLVGMLTLYFMGKILPVLQAILLSPDNRPPMRPRAVSSYWMTVMATNKGAFAVSAIALMLKCGKQWYYKQYRNLQLQKENTEARMRLLTAQVHPHFLFNTLNNISSQAQTESPKSSKMIMGLSDMLRYILYEGQKPLVPLKQELMMIREYINLEKIRYGNKLDVHVLTPDKVDEIYIAPLLLLPFVENCFKHGASNMLQNPWINLTIELKDTTLVMKLMNGKNPAKENRQGKPGIGIKNVQQRLELLYRDKYDLRIREDQEVFVVDLRVELVKRKEEPGHSEKLQTGIAYV
ncbi:MAG TPA: histidine kinase [Chitinophagaceae bacterium]